MKNELQKSDNHLEVEIRTEEEFMDLAQKTHGELSENVATLVKQNFTWMQRIIGPKGLKKVIRELDAQKLKEVTKVYEFKEQLVDLAQRAQLDALNKKYMVLISAIDAQYQEKLIQFFKTLIKKLTLDLRESAKEMLRSEKKDYEEAEEFKDNEKRYKKMIAIIDDGTGRYFRMMGSLFDKFEQDMNVNMKKYQKQLP